MGDEESGGGEDAMVYTEFLEGIAATAHHKICSPYICMAKRCGCNCWLYCLRCVVLTCLLAVWHGHVSRLDAFISDCIVPKAKQKRLKKRGTPSG